jgi:NADH-quinone oxidoreductase subunit N
MNSYLTDILNNGALMLTTLTGLIVLLIEATRKGRPTASSVVAIVGLAAAAFAAGSNLSTEAESFGGMLRHGGFANLFSLIFTLGGIATICFSREYFERMRWDRGEIYILFLFAISGMILIASANDLVVLFLGVELMSVCLYVLAGIIRIKDRSNEAALKYFLLGAFATGFLLYGIALIYGTAGSTNLSVIKSLFSQLHTQTVFVIGVALVLAGLSFKVAAVPFHMWAPDVYEGAPTPVTGFMATIAKAAAFSGILTVYVRTCDFVGMPMNDVLAILAAASMILGNLAAIAQSNIKRMLAYSSIAHAGYMLAGIAGGSIEGQTGVMFYLAAYTCMNLGAFAVVALREEKDDAGLLIEDFAGFSNQQPLFAGLMALFMFALAGIPPLAGFFGKYYVFYAAVKSGYTWLAIVGVLMSLVSAYYYLRIVVMMYFREGTASIEERPGVAVKLSIIVAAILVILLGIVPAPIVETAQRFF